jgi:hypothetical protein
MAGISHQIAMVPMPGRVSGGSGRDLCPPLCEAIGCPRRCCCVQDIIGRRQPSLGKVVSPPSQRGESLDRGKSYMYAICLTLSLPLELATIEERKNCQSSGYGLRKTSCASGT